MSECQYVSRFEISANARRELEVTREELKSGKAEKAPKYLNFSMSVFRNFGV
jgi:hypothetical protein